MKKICLLISLVWMYSPAPAIAEVHVFNFPLDAVQNVPPRMSQGLGAYEGFNAELPAELTTGGIFNGDDPLPIHDSNSGTLTIRFFGCALARLGFNFPAAGESGFFQPASGCG